MAAIWPSGSCVKYCSLLAVVVPTLGGEADEARRIKLDLDAVFAAVRRLVTGLTNLTWVTAGYGWFTIVAPILVAAPMYFAGRLSLGGLMMAAGGFTQVTEAVRQVRGAAGDHQVPGCDAVYCSGTGGIMSEQTALIVQGG